MEQKTKEAITERWRALGFLQGQNPEQTVNCALSMESMATKMLIDESDELAPWRHIIFPIVARIFNGNAFEGEVLKPFYDNVIKADEFLVYINTDTIKSLIDYEKEKLDKSDVEELANRCNLPAITTINEFWHLIFAKKNDDNDIKELFGFGGGKIDFEANFCAIVSNRFGHYLIANENNKIFN